MTLQSAQELTQQLGEECIQSRLEVEPGSWNHLLSAVKGLALVLDNPDQTKHIVRTLVSQAQHELHASTWFIHEILFEAQAFQVGDRTKWQDYQLTKGPVDDAALDRYNQRSHRFDTPENPLKC